MDISNFFVVREMPKKNGQEVPGSDKFKQIFFFAFLERDVITLGEIKMVI